jgi:hypothetical protein
MTRDKTRLTVNTVAGGFGDLEAERLRRTALEPEERPEPNKRPRSSSKFLPQKILQDFTFIGLVV